VVADEEEVAVAVVEVEVEAVEEAEEVVVEATQDSAGDHHDPTL
jgi:hypothetical protein